MHLTLGAEGDAVRELQERLSERGYDVGPIDGRFGPRTREAVAEFQREHELMPGGSIDAATAEALELDVDVASVEEERSAFNRLVAGNPNYFGNQPDPDHEPVVEKTSDTSYEEVTCVGYDPSLGRLEAIVSVKRDHGYDGSVCESGSTEFVRFFIDRERNGEWENLGIGSTRVYDIPGPKPIDYAVTLDLEPEQEPCFFPVLPRVRAVLSWNRRPPSGEAEGEHGPDFRPVWGNRLDADIQIEPGQLNIGDVLADDIPEDALEGIDVDEAVGSEAPTLETAQLLERYEGTGVSAHRAGFTEFQQLLDGSGGSATGLSSPAWSGPIDPTGPVPPGPGPEPGPTPGGGPPDVPDTPMPEPQPDPFPEDIPELPAFPAGWDIDPGDVLEDLFETSGDTSYEELDCVGLNRDVLTGVLTVKRPNGYSGGLCTAGSTEHVAFWEKDVSGGTWRHLGTGTVSVHDIPDIPTDGLQYAVHLPVDLSRHRQPCDEGPSLVRIRAVMSWNRPPPSSDPSFVPTWGNRVETVVQVPPGPPPRADGRLAIGSVGDVPPPRVEQSTTAATTGTASGPSVMGNFNASDAPFGGLVTITGRPLDGLDPDPSGSGALKYRVSVRPHRPGMSEDANPWRHLTNEPTVYSYDDLSTPREIPNDADGYYTYVPKVVGDVLAKWHTRDDGLYELKVEAKRGDGDPVHTDVISYEDGRTESVMLIKLDNTSPVSKIDITGVQKGGSGPIEDSGECDFLNVGDTVLGEFTADDDHLRRYGFSVQPGKEDQDPRVNETSSPTVLSEGGGTGEWELETSWSGENSDRDAGEMKPCGYTVSVTTVDNTIVSNSYRGHRSRDFAGFCLLPAGTEVTESDGDGGSGDGNGSNGGG